jgi:hypothetical protein
MKALLTAALRRSSATTARSRACVLAALIVLVAATGASTAAGGRDSVRAPRLGLATGGAAPATQSLVVRVAHGPVTTANSQYIDAAPAGPSVGDLRTYYLPLTRPGGTSRIGYLTGTLLTTATARPRAGMELRTADLVFVVGGPVDQIVVGGVSAYAQSASTLSKKSVVTRPVIGGSGKYAGARGWCVTTHFQNDTWTHVFHLTVERP